MSESALIVIVEGLGRVDACRPTPECWVRFEVFRSRNGSGNSCVSMALESQSSNHKQTTAGPHDVLGLIRAPRRDLHKPSGFGLDSQLCSVSSHIEQNRNVPLKGRSAQRRH